MTQYELPSTWGTGNDNVITNGQVLTLDTPAYTHEIHFLYAGDGSGDKNSEPALSVRQARFSMRWELIDGIRAQAVEVTLANMLPAFALSRETSIHSEVLVSIEGTGIQTISPGSIYRLVPSDQVRVDVFVTGSKAGGQATVRLHDTHGDDLGSSEGWAMTPLIEEWTADADVLKMHETPSWWNGAKFGIFIHWGVYSYPAWGPPTSYAEWYDSDLHQIGSPTYQHHLDTYGPNVVYDDFIPHFTASKFNASEWVDLFDKAGAQYFVLVTASRFVLSMSAGTQWLKEIA
ncbi:hypothetical protein C0992_013158 [Termitomyces sp. T32_za158]|nr:hypothetical protein C0992_013158 [Termitomyces sp. T32_za158]